MPLVPSTLSTQLRAALLATPAIGAIDGPALTALCNAIATTVDAYIKTGTVNAVGTAPPGGGPVAVVGAVT